MNLTKVTSFRVSDGSLHTDKVAALTREQQLEIHALIQIGHKKKYNMAVSSYSAQDIAIILSENSEAVNKIISKYRIAINRANGQTKKLTIQ